MEDVDWDERALEVLERFVHWWEAASPGSRLNLEEAHDMGNTILIAKLLIDEKLEEESG